MSALAFAPTAIDRLRAPLATAVAWAPIAIAMLPAVLVQPPPLLSPPMDMQVACAVPAPAVAAAMHVASAKAPPVSLTTADAPIRFTGSAPRFGLALDAPTIRANLIPGR